MPEIIQGSQEWFAQRIGKVTASRIADVMATIKSGEAATRKNYRAQLVAERLSGQVAQSYTNGAMQWGIDNEPIARGLYEIVTGQDVEQISFIDHPDISMAGASPDGLVDEDGLVEIKCPNTATHIDYLLGGCVPSEYKLQMLWQMVCTGRKWCDFVSFDPRMPRDLSMFIIRYDFDEQRAIEVSGAVKEFLNEVDLVIERLSKLKEQ